jgi:hypothetical protein
MEGLLRDKTTDAKPSSRTRQRKKMDECILTETSWWLDPGYDQPIKMQLNKSCDPIVIAWLETNYAELREWLEHNPTHKIGLRAECFQTDQDARGDKVWILPVLILARDQPVPKQVVVCFGSQAFIVQRSGEFQSHWGKYIQSVSDGIMVEEGF